jgi:hypothetical protein
VIGLDTLLQSGAGTYEILYRAEDAAGNASEVTRTVEVMDTVVPELVLIGASEVDVECHSPYVDAGVMVIDDCDSNLADAVVVSYFAEDGTELEEIDTGVPGIYRIFYNVTDNSGNEALSVVRELRIVDEEAPLFLWIGSSFENELPGEEGFYVLECSEDFEEPVDFTAADLCDGYLLPVNHRDPGEAGVLRFGWALNAEKEPLYSGGAPQIYGYDSMIHKPGDYLLCYVAYDSMGNTLPEVDGSGIPELPDALFLNEEKTELAVDFARLLRVIDTRIPVIELNSDSYMVVECTDPFIDPVSAFDDCAGDLSEFIVTTGSVNTGELGVYTLEYAVEDFSGHSAEPVLRQVEVIDTIAPVLLLNGEDLVEVECGDSFINPVTALDDCEGDLTDAIEVTSSLDMQSPGEYTLEYQVKDSSGNEADPVSLTVKVVDTTPPVLELQSPDTIELECWDELPEIIVNASDDCDGDLTGDIVVSGTVSTQIPGNYALTFTVSDSSGNEASPVKVVVKVVDTTPPEIVRGVESPGTTLVIDGFTKWQLGMPYKETTDDNAFDACDGPLGLAESQLPPMNDGQSVIAYAWALDEITKEPLWNTPGVDPEWLTLDEFVNHEGYFLVIYEARDSEGNYTPEKGTHGFVPIFDDAFQPNFREDDGNLRGELSFARLVWVTAAKMDGLSLDFAKFVADNFETWDLAGKGYLDDDELAQAWQAFMDENPLVTAEELATITDEIKDSATLTLSALEAFIEQYGTPSDTEGEAGSEGEAKLEGEVESELEGEAGFEGESDDGPVLEGESDAEGEILSEGETPDDGEDAAVGCCRSSAKRLGDVRKLFGDWLLIGLSLMALGALAQSSRKKG